jgi:hypothetical protein
MQTCNSALFASKISQCLWSLNGRYVVTTVSGRIGPCVKLDNTETRGGPPKKRGD